jgi:hypothetical protein
LFVRRYFGPLQLGSEEEKLVRVSQRAQDYLVEAREDMLNAAAMAVGDCRTLDYPTSAHV